MDIAAIQQCYCWAFYYCAEQRREGEEVIPHQGRMDRFHTSKGGIRSVGTVRISGESPGEEALQSLAMGG